MPGGVHYTRPRRRARLRCACLHLAFRQARRPAAPTSRKLAHRPARRGDHRPRGIGRASGNAEQRLVRVPHHRLVPFGNRGVLCRTLLGNCMLVLARMHLYRRPQGAAQSVAPCQHCRRRVFHRRHRPRLCDAHGHHVGHNACAGHPAVHGLCLHDAAGASYIYLFGIYEQGQAHAHPRRYLAGGNRFLLHSHGDAAHGARHATQRLWNGRRARAALPGRYRLVRRLPSGGEPREPACYASPGNARPRP